MKNLAVFISGFGSNLQTIAEFCEKNHNLAKIQVVISNKEGVNGLKIAQSFGIKSAVIPTKGRKMHEFEQDCKTHLEGVDIICLAGFMRILSPEFTKQWREKMVNIHPSLLPSFKGDAAINDALSFGVKITGCTVHFVEAEIDSGRIIAQEPVRIDDFENENSLRAKMKFAEKIAYTNALKALVLKDFTTSSSY